jgi:hypothetical protein
MKASALGILTTLVTALSLCGCGDDPDDEADHMVACQLDAVDQCFEWINLRESLVDSLSSTCVDDDGGVIVDSCPTENLVGICEELGNDPAPDLLNHFYLPAGEDPVDYSVAKGEACVDAGGVWDPV